jgi:hypothetical protein
MWSNVSRCHGAANWTVPAYFIDHVSTNITTIIFTKMKLKSVRGGAAVRGRSFRNDRRVGRKDRCMFALYYSGDYGTKPFCSLNSNNTISFLRFENLELFILN